MEITNNQILCVGELLWDNLPSGAKPGGAPMNVALHLSRLGQNVTVASKVGNDEKGRTLLGFLQTSGLKTEMVQIDEALPTSEVLVHLDANNNATYEICEPVAWDNLELTDELVAIAKDSGLIIYGSLASRRPKSRETLLRLLETDAIKLVDINLRKPYDTQELVELLLRKSDIIKLNDDELEVISKWNNVSALDEFSLIKWFADKYNSPLVCVTKGENGAIIYSDGAFYSHPGFKVDAVDTVGAGDAFLAGFISALLDGKPTGEALEFACATGSFVAGKTGATPEYQKEDILEMLTI